MPNVSPPAISASNGVVICGTPPETANTAPYSKAFTPIVAMIALSWMKPTRIPFNKPAAEAQATAIKTAGRSMALFPSGTWVDMTTARDTPPATERSNPPCWTTSNCARPTMAINAANGRLPSSAPDERLDGANDETDADQSDR